jgi:hypothetical protein
MFATLNLRALGWAACWTAALVVFVVLGSRNLQHFDAALVAYLFGTIFAMFGLVYRYAVWLQRPPTRLYWQRGWQLMFSRAFPAYLVDVARRVVTELAAQHFIFKRSAARGLAHVLIAWGVLSAFAITLPLTFGWVHFTLKNGTTDVYQAHLFGFAGFEFNVHGFVAFNLFHGLNWSSLAVIAGVMMAIRRRITHAGAISTQTFDFDLVPLMLLMVVALTGLGITFDYELMQGKAYPFMGLTHAVAVIVFLIYLPFGKFFHIFQRPAQLGVALYHRQNAKGPAAVCPHTGVAFAPQQHVDDLKIVTREVGFDFALKGGGSHLDLSPQGKRAALANAHLAARAVSGHFFG